MKKRKQQRLSPFSEENVSWRRLLESKPVRNSGIKFERSDNDADGMCVHIKGKKPAFLIPPISWVIRPRLNKRMWIDKIGVQLWDLCDGTRTMEQVIDGFASTHRLTFHEARVSVTGYLKGLVERGVIAVVVK